MSYIKETLLPDEKVLYYTRPHIVIFYPAVMWLILSLPAFKIISSSLIGWIFLFMSIVGFVNSLVGYYFSEYAITDKRILMKVGFVRRKSLELFLNRVEGVYIEQGIVGRILNFGTVIIIGVGGTKDPFFYIPDPLKFRGSVQQQMPNSGDGGK